jgi:hypothetical protein
MESKAAKAGQLRQGVWDVYLDALLDVACTEYSVLPVSHSHISRLLSPPTRSPPLLANMNKVSTYHTKGRKTQRKERKEAFMGV